VAEIYLQHAEKHGFRKTPESLAAIKSAFTASFRDAPPPVFAATEPAAIKQSERLWWFDIVHNVFYRVGMFEAFDEFFEEVFARFEQPESWRLFPETVEVLKTLKDQDSSWASFPISIRGYFPCSVVWGLPICSIRSRYPVWPMPQTVRAHLPPGAGETCGRSGRGAACRRQRT
jgi:hypothetical protein